MNANSASLLCALRGPLTLITLGVLFAVNNFTPYSFDRTWPVLLIVFGLLTLLCRGAEPAQPQPPYPGAPYGYPGQAGQPVSESGRPGAPGSAPRGGAA